MAFRSGARKHPEMNFFSGRMTQQEIEEIVQYYAKLRDSLELIQINKD